MESSRLIPMILRGPLAVDNTSWAELEVNRRRCKRTHGRRSTGKENYVITNRLVKSNRGWETR